MSIAFPPSNGHLILLQHQTLDFLTALSKSKLINTLFTWSFFHNGNYYKQHHLSIIKAF